MLSRCAAPSFRVDRTQRDFHRGALAHLRAQASFFTLSPAVLSVPRSPEARACARENTKVPPSVNATSRLMNVLSFYSRACLCAFTLTYARERTRIYPRTSAKGSTASEGTHAHMHSHPHPHENESAYVARDIFHGCRCCLRGYASFFAICIVCATSRSAHHRHTCT